MKNVTLEEILNSLPKISSNRSYWFFRTNGGQYYEDFYKKNYIAIGYNEVSLSDIKAGQTKDYTGIEILTSIIEKIYKSANRPGYIASQLLKFSYEMKKGDIVLIPSYNSSDITFGEVIETPVYIAKPKDEVDCPFLKRKKIKWLKTISREKLDPNLYKLMFSHHTITEASFYAEFIDKITNSFFIKGDKANLVLKVETTNEIKAKDLFELGGITLDLLDEFCKEEGLNYKSDDFNIKLNLQSPGLILLSGISMGGVVIIGIILVSIAGGGFTLSSGEDLKVGIKTDGIIEKIRTFLISKSNIRTKKKLLEKHMKDLQIKDPEDLTDVLKELDK